MPNQTDTDNAYEIIVAMRDTEWTRDAIHTELIARDRDAFPHSYASLCQALRNAQALARQFERHPHLYPLLAQILSEPYRREIT